MSVVWANSSPVIDRLAAAGKYNQGLPCGINHKCQLTNSGKVVGMVYPFRYPLVKLTWFLTS